MSTISIIVPVYKVEAYLNRCVDSILSQTFNDFELILVDDGSPDNCGEICDRYALQDKRVHVIHQDNKGLSEARNAGIDWVFEYSESEWIGFVDSDDWIHRCYLELLYNAAKKTNCNISMCIYERRSGYEADKIVFPDFEKWTAEEAYSLKYTRDCYAYAWGRLYKKRCFQSVRFPKGRAYEDIYTTYKVIFKESWIAVVNYGLYYYYNNPESITNSAWNPKMMDNFYAREDLIHFLSSTEYRQLYKNNVKAYIYILTEQYEQTKRQDQFTIYNKLIEKKLKKAICEYRALFSIREIGYAYAAVFPLYSRMYWIMSKKKETIKKLFKI